MYPDNNQPPQQSYSIDYLNQIAPQKPKKSLGGPFLKIFVGLGIVAVIVIIVGVVLNMQAVQAPSMTLLAARLSATEKIVNDSQNDLTSGRLRTANSNLSLYLTNITRDLDPLLASDGHSMSKLPSSVVEAESTEDLSTKLENDRLLGVFDSSYSREMSYKLQTIIYLISQLQESTTGDRLEFLNKARNDLEPIQNELANYTS